MIKDPRDVPAQVVTPMAPVPRFGAGLTEAEVRRLRVILREDCGVDLPLPEAWGRAIEVLSLVELLLRSSSIVAEPSAESSSVRASSLLTDSPP